MAKIVWTNWGSNIAIGVYAETRKAAERIYNGCYNYEATNGDFHIVKEDAQGCFGYFSSNWENMKKVRDIPYIAPFLPKTEAEIDSSRENYLDKILKAGDLI